MKLTFHFSRSCSSPSHKNHSKRTRCEYQRQWQRKFKLWYSEHHRFMLAMERIKCSLVCMEQLFSLFIQRKAYSLQLQDYNYNTFITILANWTSEVLNLTLEPLINKPLAKIEVSSTLKISQGEKRMRVLPEIYFWLFTLFPSQDTEILWAQVCVTYH